MEDTPANAATRVVCPMCRLEVDADDAFCNHCGFPRKGTEQQQRLFWLKRDTKKKRLAEADKKIRQASNTLFVVGAITFFFSLGVYLWGYYGSYIGDLPQFLSNALLGLVFVALGFWCKAKPLPAILSGLSLYLLWQVINLVVSPSTFLHAYVYKLFVIGFLIVGLRAVFEGEKLKKELNA